MMPSRLAGRCFVLRSISPPVCAPAGMSVENLKITEVPPARFRQAADAGLVRLRQVIGVGVIGVGVIGVGVIDVRVINVRPARLRETDGRGGMHHVRSDACT
jgi:hypothetical protein